MESRLIGNPISGTHELRFDRPVKVKTDDEVLEADRCHHRILPRAARFHAGDAPYVQP